MVGKQACLTTLGQVKAQPPIRISCPQQLPLSLPLSPASPIQLRVASRAMVVQPAEQVPTAGSLNGAQQGQEAAPVADPVMGPVEPVPAVGNPMAATINGVQLVEVAAPVADLAVGAAVGPVADPVADPVVGAAVGPVVDPAVGAVAGAVVGAVADLAVEAVDRRRRTAGSQKKLEVPAVAVQEDGAPNHTLTTRNMVKQAMYDSLSNPDN